MAHEAIRALLRAHGFRSTRGRVSLLAELRKAGRPLTHAELLKRLSSTRFNRVSIYRALDALVQAGLVHRAYVGGRRSAFETAERCEERRCHPHFTCLKCGAVTCLTGVNVPLVRGLPKGYVVVRQKVHIDGACAACSGARRRKEADG